MYFTDEEVNKISKHYENMLTKATYIISYFENEDPEIYLLRYLKLHPKTEKALSLLGIYFHRYMMAISNHDKKLRKYYIDSAIEIYTKLLTFHPNYKFYNFEDGLKSNHSLLCEFSELDGVKMSKSLVFDFKIYALSYVNVENLEKAIIYYKEILKLKPVNKFSKEQLFLCSLKLENGN